MSGVQQVSAALDSFGEGAWSWLVGTPCFKAPVQIQEELREAAGRSHAAYSPAAGDFGFREAIAELHRREGSSVNAENVIVTPGAKAGLLVLLSVVLRPGNEILHPVPSYPAYPNMARLLGATPVGVAQSGRDYEGWMAAVERNITSRSRAVVLSSPSNPSGATLDQAQILDLAALCRDHGLLLVLDEAYSTFRFEGETRCESCDVDLDSSCVVRSFSKTYAVCGLRLGYILAGEVLAEEVATRQSALVNPPSSIAQMAMGKVLEVPASYTEASRRIVRERLSVLRQILRNLGIDAAGPQGGFYLWFELTEEVTRGRSSVDWCESLAREQGIGLWPGEDFGSPGWVRLSAVSPQPAEWNSAVTDLESRLSEFLNRC